MSSNISRTSTAKGTTISFGGNWLQEHDRDDEPRIKKLKFCDGHVFVTNMKELATRFFENPLGQVVSRFFLINGKTYDSPQDRRTIEARENEESLSL